MSLIVRGLFATMLNDWMMANILNSTVEYARLRNRGSALIAVLKIYSTALRGSNFQNVGCRIV